MKFLKNLPSYLLAIIFLFASSAYFYMLATNAPFPEMPGIAGEYNHALMSSGFMTLVKTLEIILGIMILVPKTRKLALILIAPISINVFLFEVMIAGIVGAGPVLVVLNAIALYQNRESYRGIFV